MRINPKLVTIKESWEVRTKPYRASINQRCNPDGDGDRGSIMPYARPLTDDEWQTFDYDAFMAQDEYLVLVPVEKKRDSFGILHGKVVAVDYG